MNLDARINRRQRDVAGLVLDEALLSPVAHVADLVSRGPTLETLLDYLDPVLDGDLPPNASIWVPAGAGKSAVVIALFTHLRPRPSELGAIVHASTRTQPGRERSYRSSTRTDDPRERLWESLSEYIETHVVAQQQDIEFASWRQRPGRLTTGGTQNNADPRLTTGSPGDHPFFPSRPLNKDLCDPDDEIEE